VRIAGESEAGTPRLQQRNSAGAPTRAPADPQVEESIKRAVQPYFVAHGNIAARVRDGQAFACQSRDYAAPSTGRWKLGSKNSAGERVLAVTLTTAPTAAWLPASRPSAWCRHARRGSTTCRLIAAHEILPASREHPGVPL
jgi:hypothetical protein